MHVRQEPRPDLSRLDRRFRSALMAFFTRRIRDRTEAEDLTQEVFTRLARRSGDDGAAPDGYVFAVASNLLNDRFRRAGVARRYLDDRGAEDEAAIDPLDPHRVAAGRDELARIARAIAELPEKTRRIFILYRIENIDKATIAESFGLTTRMIEIHVRRALDALVDHRESDA